MESDEIQVRKIGETHLGEEEVLDFFQQMKEQREAHEREADEAYKLAKERSLEFARQLEAEGVGAEHWIAIASFFLGRSLVASYQYTGLTSGLERSQSLVEAAFAACIGWALEGSYDGPIFSPPKEPEDKEEND